MPSSASYRDFIQDQLSGLEDIRFRAMMGEYLLYYRGKLVGGIYDDRLLIKETARTSALIPDAPRELPYPGAREMLLVENVDDPVLLEQLLDELYQDLPMPKARSGKQP